MRERIGLLVLVVYGCIYTLMFSVFGCICMTKNFEAALIVCSYLSSLHVGMVDDVIREDALVKHSLKVRDAA